MNSFQEEIVQLRSTCSKSVHGPNYIKQLVWEITLSCRLGIFITCFCTCLIFKITITSVWLGYTEEVLIILVCSMSVISLSPRGLKDVPGNGVNTKQLQVRLTVTHRLLR